MINSEIANIFFDIADYLEMEDIPFKPAAYRRAALMIDNMNRDLKDIYDKDGKKALLDIPGIGQNLGDKIEEYIQTGKVAAHEKYKKKVPVDMENLTKIEGLGPKRIKELYQKLGVKNISDLEKAIASHQVGKLFGFGEKTEKNILSGISFLKINKQRFPLKDILPKVDGIIATLKNLKEVKKISVAGSVRRKKETIGDVDILVVSSNPEKIMDAFIKLPGVFKVWAVGATKASIAMEDGFDVDLRIVPEASYGAALQYFTGSKEHNIFLRKIAQGKGLKLNEYGVFRGDKMIAGKTEEEVYEALGQKWIPPEERV